MYDPQDWRRDWELRGILWGIFLIILGAWWMLGTAGIVWFSWTVIAPLALMLVGLSLVLRRTRWQR